MTALAVSPDCRTLVLATRSLYVRVYDMGTGAQLRSWRAHRMPVADLAVDASGGYVATASADRTVKVGLRLLRRTACGRWMRDGSSGECGPVCCRGVICDTCKGGWWGSGVPVRAPAHRHAAVAGVGLNASGAYAATA